MNLCACCPSRCFSGSEPPKARAGGLRGGRQTTQAELRASGVPPPGWLSSGSLKPGGKLAPESDVSF